jgi:hypothetical protein
MGHLRTYLETWKPSSALNNITQNPAFATYPSGYQRRMDAILIHSHAFRVAAFDALASSLFEPLDFKIITPLISWIIVIYQQPAYFTRTVFDGLTNCLEHLLLVSHMFILWTNHAVGFVSTFQHIESQHGYLLNLILAADSKADQVAEVVVKSMCFTDPSTLSALADLGLLGLSRMSFTAFAMQTVLTCWCSDPIHLH